MPSHRLTPHVIADEASLRARLGEPTDLVRKKIADRLNRLTRQFVERAPFVCLATASREGTADVSPRGGAPGFVRILDDCTLLIPERPGNKLADSLRNILANPHLGLLFIIPGVGDTFRINGRATITTDANLLAACAVDGKLPQLGILVDIEEAYLHCSKAFLRSQLWDPARFVDRTQLPSGGELLAEITRGEVDAKQYDQERAARYARGEGL